MLIQKSFKVGSPLVFIMGVLTVLYQPFPMASKAPTDHLKKKAGASFRNDPPLLIFEFQSEA